MAHCNVVEVVNANSLLRHQIVGKSFLKFWCHEIISWSGSVQDGKVYLEPEQVHQERNDDQPNDARSEVLAEIRKTERSTPSVNVQQLPEVDHDWHANREEREGSNILRADDAAHADTSQQQPLPPLPAERIVAKLVKPDVAENARCHEQD